MNEADSDIDKTENLLNPSSNQARMYRSSTMNFTHSFNRENPLIDNNEEQEQLNDSHRNLLDIPDKKDSRGLIKVTSPKIGMEAVTKHEFEINIEDVDKT